MRAAWSLHVLAACAFLAPAPPVAAAPDGPMPLWRIPLDSLGASVDRPLMSPSRRPKPPPVAPPPQPPPAPVAAAPPPPPEPMRATLLGVVIASDEAALAILRDDGDQSVRRVRVGEGFAGWTLTAIRRREVDFRRDMETMTLPLPAPAGGAVGNPALAALTRFPSPGGQSPEPPGIAAARRALGAQSTANPLVPAPMPMPARMPQKQSLPPGLTPGQPAVGMAIPMPSPVPAGGNIGLLPSPPLPGGVLPMFNPYGQNIPK